MAKRPLPAAGWLQRGIARAINVFSPAAATRYLHRARHFLAYAAATKTGPNGAWRPRSRSGDEDLKRDAAMVTSRARDLAANNPFIKGAIRKIGDNCVRDGIRPQAQLKRADGELDEVLNARLEARFKRWAHRRYASVSGHDSFWSMQKQIMRAVWTDGEILARRVWTTNNGSAAPFRIELIEADQLDTMVDGRLDNGNTAVRGIEFDSSGRPAAYHILDEHPGSWMGILSKSQRVDARDVIHVYDKERVSMTRAVSWFAAVIMDAYDLAEYQHFEAIGAKLAAAFGVFVKTNYPEVGGDSIEGFQDPHVTYNDLPEYLEPGRLQALPPGTDISIASHNRPGQTYEPHVKTRLKAQATGAGLSYNSFTGDYAETNYSGARSGALEERLSYGGMQDFLIEKFCEDVWAWFLEAEYLVGRIQLPGYASDPDLYLDAVQWQKPGWPWVDPDKDSKAAERDVNNCFTSPQRICAARGYDFETVVKEKARAKRLMNEYGVTPEEIAEQTEQIEENEDAQTETR